MENQWQNQLPKGGRQIVQRMKISKVTIMVKGRIIGIRGMNNLIRMSSGNMGMGLRVKTMKMVGKIAKVKFSSVATNFSTSSN